MVTHRSQSWSWMIDSHPFHSMSISPPIPQIRIFQTLTLKLQDQGHPWENKWSRWAHGELTVTTVVTGPGPNDHGSVTARRGHSSVTARSQLNHGPGHGSVTAGCDHFGHRELSQWLIFFSWAKVWSKGKTIQSAQYLINRLSFCITIPEIQLFWNLKPWKIKGQGHGWGQRSRSHSSPSIQPMHLLYTSHQSDQPFLRHVQQSVWPWKNTSEIFKEKFAKNIFLATFLQNLTR